VRILILGGTRFVGKHLAEIALERGHSVTLFNRGKTNPDWFPSVEKLNGNRDGDLQVLADRTWDAVIDTCGYLPRVVSLSANALSQQVGHYTFISSISVYADFSQPGLDENSPLATTATPEIEEITNDTYGPLKALCEKAVETALPGRTLIIRPGLIVGPYDPTDRFTYWPVRVAAGGDMLAPVGPNWQTQIIDARDLAAWNIRLVEGNVTGVYNATGPEQPLTFGEVLEVSQDVSASQPYISWLPEEYLLSNGVQPWSELPLWLPGEENAGADQVNIQKALAAGLIFRSLAETIRDTLAWAAQRPGDHVWRAGLNPERETELIQMWKRISQNYRPG
jgi:2'-hydroxyisoflavone reductase